MWSRIAHSQNNTLDASGMTLVELLLAVTFFSTMLGATGSLLQSGLRAQLTWGQATAPYLQMERALDGVERDVASARRFFGMPVVGAKDRLELARIDARSIDGAPASPEWLKVVYRIDKSGESPSLIREEYLWRQGAGAGDALARQTVLSVEEGSFTFGRLDAQGQLVWTDAWDGAKDGLPKLVRLSARIRAARGSESIARTFRNPSGNLPAVEQP